MHPLEVIHQLILPREPVHALAGTVTEWTVEVFGTGFVASHVTRKVVLVLKALSAADVGAGETTVGEGVGDRRPGGCGGGDGSCVQRLRGSRSWSKTNWVVIEVTIELSKA